MNNNLDFNIKIVDFYNDIDKPIINKLYNDQEFKNLLELSVDANIPIFKKNKNKLKIKDKRILLKEAEQVKKRKIKEITTNLNTKEDIKINNKLMSDIETINNFKKNVELNNNLEKLSHDKKYIGGSFIHNIKIIDIMPSKKENSDDDYIEVFSN
jgi:hypothetical protein